MSDTNGHSDAEQSLGEMLEIVWLTNWSELPTDAEYHAEKAFEHLAQARDALEHGPEARKRRERRADVGADQ